MGNVLRQKIILSIALALFFCAAVAHAGQPDGPTVAAALSLKRAFEDIAPIYEAGRTGGGVVFNFAASGVLQRQIEGGAPVDVFASASSREMDALEREGLLLKGTRTAFARNSMVLIVPEGSAAGIEGPADLGMDAVRRIVIGNPATVPAGKYAEEALRSLGLWDIVREKLVFAEHVRQVVDYTARGEVDAGIVFATDVIDVAGIALIDEFPAESHSPALYYVAVVRDAPNVAEARAFIAVLGTAPGRSALRRRGFLTAP